VGRDADLAFARASPAQIVGNALKRWTVRTNPDDRSKGLLQGRQQPICGEPNEGEMSYPRTRSFAASARVQRDRHQGADSGAFQNLPGSLRDRQGTDNRRRYRSATACKLIDKKGLCLQQDDCLDRPQALADNLGPLGVMTALREPVSQ